MNDRISLAVKKPFLFESRVSKRDTSWSREGKGRLDFGYEVSKKECSIKKAVISFKDHWAVKFELTEISLIALKSAGFSS